MKIVFVVLSCRQTRLKFLDLGFGVLFCERGEMMHKMF